MALLLNRKGLLVQAGVIGSRRKSRGLGCREDGRPSTTTAAANMASSAPPSEGLFLASADFLTSSPAAASLSNATKLRVRPGPRLPFAVVRPSG